MSPRVFIQIVCHMTVPPIVFCTSRHLWKLFLWCLSDVTYQVIVHDLHLPVSMAIYWPVLAHLQSTVCHLVYYAVSAACNVALILYVCWFVHIYSHVKCSDNFRLHVNFLRSEVTPKTSLKVMSFMCWKPFSTLDAAHLLNAVETWELSILCSHGKPMWGIFWRLQYWWCK